MKYRLLMLSPVFEEATLPEIVRPDVAETYRVVEYESPEELAALLQAAVILLVQDATETPAGASEDRPPPGVQAP